MLSPLPIASALGLGASAVPLCAVSVLSVNGTVIGLSTPLAATLRDLGPVSVLGACGGVDLLAVCPWPSRAEWIGLQLARRTGLDRAQSMRIARDVFRPDIYPAALDSAGIDMPRETRRVEGACAVPTAVSSAFGRLTLMRDQFFDCRVFDPNAAQ